MTVAAVDTGRLVALLPALARRWRALRFEQGRYVDDAGRPRDGFQVEHGCHPRPGTRYRLVTASTAVEAAGRSEAVLNQMSMELLADGARRIRVRFRVLASGEVVEVELENPARPARLVVEATVPVEGNWLVRGPVSACLELDLAALTPVPTGARQLNVRARHPRARALARVHVEPAGGGQWSVAVQVQAAGRGLARPFVAAVAPFAHRRAAREFDSLLQQLAKSVDELNRELAAQFGRQHDPDQLASDLLADLLDTVPERRPPPASTSW